MTVRQRLTAAGFAAAALVFLAAHFGSEWDLSRRRRALTAAIDRERRALPDRPRALVESMDDVILEAAKTPWPGDWAEPGLESPEARAALFARSMVYLRAAVPELERLDAIGAAARRSDKDTAVLCLVRPPSSRAPEDVRTAATRYWIGGGLFEDATHEVFALDVVHKGLRPLTRAFSAEIAEADGSLWLRRLEEEYDQRTPHALLMARIAADSDLFVVVGDELPAGFAPPELGKSLTQTRRPAVLPSIEDAPHAVRAVVWSAERRAIVLRVRAEVDARSVLAGTPPSHPVAASAIHGCQIALALRPAT